MVQLTVTDITYEFSTSCAWFKDLYKVNKPRQSAAMLLDVFQFPYWSSPWREAGRCATTEAAISCSIISSYMKLRHCYSSNLSRAPESNTAVAWASVDSNMAASIC